MKNRKENLLSIVFFLVLSSIWIAPGLYHLQGFLFHPNAQFSDVLISHWPNMYFVRNALQTWKAFPLWNPMILSGAPLVGDPLFGIWYLPNWLGNLLPVEMAINLLFWLHLIWAGWGMYQWMRSEGYHWGGALVAGIAFSGMPKLIGHIGLGHLSLVSSIAWTPWLMLVIRKMVISLSSGEKNTIRWFALGGGVAAILFLADPRWIIPAAFLVILYAIRSIYAFKLQTSILSKNVILNTAGFTVIFLGMISGLLIPMIEFTSHSTRMGLTPEEITNLSLPLPNLIGLIIPQFGAWPETITYVGLFVLGLAAIAMMGRIRGWGFWLGIVIGSILLALGNQTPIYPILLKLIPLLRILRVPARFSILGFFSIAVLAGSGIDLFLRKDFFQKIGRWFRPGIIGIASLLMLLGIGSVLLLKGRSKNDLFPYFQMIIGSIVFLCLVFYSMKDNVPERNLIALWVVTVFLDLFLVNKTLLTSHSKEEVFKESELASVLNSEDDSIERIFSPSYSIPQNVAAVESLQLADGVNPLQLRNYWQSMSQIVGFDPEGYSVTLPPFPDGNPATPRYTKLDTVALGKLNVVYVVSEYEIASERLQIIQEKEGTFIYHNENARPRAWIESVSVSEDNEWRKVDSIDWSPNHISIKAQGDGLLILSEQYYPGWEAFVNGIKVEITPYPGNLRSVPLGKGENLVEFHYRPWSVYSGLIITFFALFSFGYIWFKK